MFPNSICPGLMKNLDKTAGVQVSGVFGNRKHVDSRMMF